MKPYMLPLTRNESSSRTPGKMLPPAISQRYTGTIKKQPYMKNNRFKSPNTLSKSSVKKSPYRKTFVVPSRELSFMHQTAESVDNNTFNILNFSSSTEVEGPDMTQNQQLTSSMATAPPISSPLTLKIDKAFDAKFKSHMETQNKRRADTMLESTQFQYTVTRAIRNDGNESVDGIFDDDSEMVKVRFFIELDYLLNL